MSRKKQNFRQMLDEIRLDRPAHKPPISWPVIARKVCVSKPHLFNLMNGRKIAPEWTVALIARRLGKEPAEVQAALDQSVAEARARPDN